MIRLTNHKTLQFSAFAVLFLVFFSSLFAHSSIVTDSPVNPSWRPVLALPVTYQLLSPLSRTLDMLSLLSATQHWFVLGSAVLLYLGIRGYRHRSRRRISPVRELASLGKYFLGLAAVYLAVALLPRPMARLSLADRDLIVVDFHSHTNESHDGRPGFTLEANRAWHEKAGFTAVYISDHRKYLGLAFLRAELPPKPHTATLLPAFEAREVGAHVVVLGMPVSESEDPERHLTKLIGQAPNIDTLPFQMILTLPDELGAIELAKLKSSGKLTAIELDDGSPRGLGQTDMSHDRILGDAAALNLSLVAGSNNHGWGFTADAWNVMRIPSWYRMSPVVIDSAIRSSLENERKAAVTLIYRRRVPTSHSIFGNALVLPRIIWDMLTTLTWTERGIWAVWIALVLMFGRSAAADFPARKVLRRARIQDGSQPLAGV